MFVEHVQGGLWLSDGDELLRSLMNVVSIIFCRRWDGPSRVSG